MLQTRLIKNAQNAMVRQESRIHDRNRSIKPLYDSSIGERIAIPVIGYGLYLLIRYLGGTLRFEEPEGWSGLDRKGWEDLETAWSWKPNTVNAFWHDRLFLLSSYWRGPEAAILVSKSFDGEYVARTAARFGATVVRGSSSRGGREALGQMIDLARNGSRFNLTVDGPRGPRYKAKSGAIMLAAKTGLPVLPVTAGASGYWRLNSWDRLMIPRPFARVKVFFGEPVFVAGPDARYGIRAKVEELQTKLDELSARAEDWENSG